MMFPGSKAEPKGNINLVHVFPSLLRAPSKYEVAKKELPLQIRELTPLLVSERFPALQVEPLSSDQ